jgi:hypothetical protein
MLTLDPFYETADGKTQRREPPKGLLKSDVEKYRRIMKQAWRHDRNFLCCYGFDMNIGWATFVVLLPLVGQFWLLIAEAILVSAAEKLRFPQPMRANMTSRAMLVFSFRLFLSLTLSLYGYTPAPQGMLFL